MELGLATFADVSPGANPEQVAQRLRDLLEEIELADRLGLEVFGVGEHHRPDYAVSATTVALGAAAARTKKIRLSSAVTVLSSADPVRVFQEYATLDLISNGRAEIMAGRGSFIESFPLFGYDLDDYDELFAERLELLLEVARVRAGHMVGQAPGAAERRRCVPKPDPAAAAGVDCRRRHPRLGGARRHARTAADDRDHRRGAGAVRAARGSLSPGGRARAVGAERTGRRTRPDRPIRDNRHACASKRTTTIEALAGPAVGINSHMYIAETSQQAANEFYPAYPPMMNRIGRERGWPPITRQQFDTAAVRSGALLVGSPQQVAEKIIAEHELFGNDRFLGHISVGTLPHERAMRATELFGAEVAPIVRAALGRQS